MFTLRQTNNWNLKGYVYKVQPHYNAMFDILGLLYLTDNVIGETMLNKVI